MAREKAKDPRKDAPAKGRPAKAKDKAAPVVESPTATPLDAEVRRTRLKTLITLGKERGYLTYAEISDHLPDDVADAEQIEGIIATFNNMGIQVYDEAPAAEDLLMSDSVATNVDEDVAEEEAEQALSSVDSEFGRTTDPVRMYMREMGTVELLTREGEIEIAKRIEDGLKHMVQAISACPTTIHEVLTHAEKIGAGTMRIDEVVDGLIDPNAEETDFRAAAAPPARPSPTHSSCTFSWPTWATFAPWWSTRRRPPTASSTTRSSARRVSSPAWCASRWASRASTTSSPTSRLDSPLRPKPERRGKPSLSAAGNRA